MVQRCPSNGNKRHTHVEKKDVHGKCRKDQKYCAGGKCRSDVADEAAETVAKRKYVESPLEVFCNLKVTLKLLTGHLIHENRVDGHDQEPICGRQNSILP